MKKFVSIPFIAIAVLMLLVFAVVPHHHHGVVSCMVEELCEQDDAVNDEHTKHHNSDESKPESCLAEADFVAPTQNNKEKCASSCDHDNHTHIFPTLFLLSEFLTYSVEDASASKTEYGEYVFSFQSTYVNQYNGLRAPPFC